MVSLVHGLKITGSGARPFERLACRLFLLAVGAA